jgi:hypothetical protein
LKEIVTAGGGALGAASSGYFDAKSSDALALRPQDAIEVRSKTSARTGFVEAGRAAKEKPKELWPSSNGVGSALIAHCPNN